MRVWGLKTVSLYACWKWSTQKATGKMYPPGIRGKLSGRSWHLECVLGQDSELCPYITSSLQVLLLYRKLNMISLKLTSKKIIFQQFYKNENIIIKLFDKKIIYKTLKFIGR